MYASLCRQQGRQKQIDKHQQIRCSSVKESKFGLPRLNKHLRPMKPADVRKQLTAAARWLKNFAAIKRKLLTTILV